MIMIMMMMNPGKKLLYLLAVILTTGYGTVPQDAYANNTFPPSSLITRPASFILYPSHKFHASIAQLEYKAEEQTVEAVIRFFADDFEIAISQYANREIKLNTPQALKDKINNEVVFSYVRERFELKGRDGKAVRFVGVGMELQADMVWVYFEGKLPGGLAGAQVRNRVLQELFDDQVNIVNFKFDGQQTGALFSAQDGFKPVPEKKK